MQVARSDRQQASNVIRVIVIDNHPLVREGLALILDNQCDMMVAAQGDDGEEAVELFLRFMPDVAVIDLSMPKMNGADATAKILAKVPKARVLILTTYDGHHDIQRSMQAGAKGYVLKNSPRSEVLDAIRRVHRGQSYLSPSVGGKLADSYRIHPLTPREYEVLALLAKGKANKEIAASLEVAEGTVKAHVNSVRSKMGVSSRTEAALAGMRSGLINGR